MKYSWIQNTLVAVVALLSSLAALAQKQDKEDKSAQTIVITRTGNTDKKVVVEVDGDKVKINGKDAKDNKDVSVQVVRVKDLQALMGSRTPGAPTWNFGPNDEGITLFHEDANRAMLGVVTEPTEGGGARIRTVQKESAADKAGLKTGDVITRMGERQIEDPEGVSQAVRAHKPGDKVSITVQRGGKEQKLSATLDKWKGVPLPPMPPATSFNLDNFNFRQLPGGTGVYMRSARPRLGLSIQDTEEGRGVKVLEVEEESAAAKAGLKAGDVITKVNGDEVGSTDAVSSEVRSSEPGEPIRLEVQRGGKTQNFELRLPRKLKTAEL